MGAPETEKLKENRVADWLGIESPKAPADDLDERFRRVVREELLPAAAEREP